MYSSVKNNGLSSSHSQLLTTSRRQQQQQRRRWRKRDILLLFASLVAATGSTTAFVAPIHVTSAAIDFPRKRRGISGRFVGGCSSSGTMTMTPLMAVAKTGGRLIRTAEEYAETVLVETPAATDEDSAAAAAGSPQSSSANTRPVLVFFTAPWCGPCRLAIPVVKDVMEQFAPEMDLLEVCTDDLPEVAADAGVVSIPTIQMYCEGELMETIVGCVAKTVLASAVEKVLEDVAIRFGTDGDGDDGGSVSSSSRQ